MKQRGEVHIVVALVIMVLLFLAVMAIAYIDEPLTNATYTSTPVRQCINIGPFKC